MTRYYGNCHNCGWRGYVTSRLPFGKALCEECIRDEERRRTLFSRWRTGG